MMLMSLKDVIIYQAGASNKKALLSCIVGSVASSIFGA